MDNLFPNTRANKVMKSRKKDVQSSTDKVQKFLSSMMKPSKLFKQNSGQYNFVQKTPASTSQEKYAAGSF